MFFSSRRNFSFSFKAFAAFSRARQLDPSVLSVAVSPKTASLKFGETKQFTATVSVKDGAHHFDIVRSKFIAFRRFDGYENRISNGCVCNFSYAIFSKEFQRGFQIRWPDRIRIQRRLRRICRSNGKSKRSAGKWNYRRGL